jgi:hypothetical protein
MHYRGVESTAAQDERHEWLGFCNVGPLEEKRIEPSRHQRGCSGVKLMT